MELPAKQVLEIFKQKGLEYIYHANTVRTVCSFLRTNHLLARGVLHERDLDQTDQQTDKKDRSLGIWYDLFFDSTDIHTRVSGRNFYGPVQLCFDLSLLEQDWLPAVWITKSNPQYWDVNTPADQRWFTSIQEVAQGYNPESFGQHIVLRNVGGNVRLLPYLKKIILDNPKRSWGANVAVDLYSEAIGALRNAARVGGMMGKMPPSELRICTNCRCGNQYQIMSTTVARKLFGS